MCCHRGNETAREGLVNLGNSAWHLNEAQSPFWGRIRCDIFSSSSSKQNL